MKENFKEKTTMNKDETKMIEEMAKIVQSKTIYTAMAEALYNANCRIIGEDEIVFNAYQLHDEFKKHEQETARDFARS